ncbi:hypothetical protein PENANT_c152G11107 [Penicillium antarcticum]|uniref:Uncharacterized protein n=1 Tax=Penicillium antarcticum TaxID=416450 RepID=A0A1V6PEU3_9EURO|nr:hypothetical protein PENANT_c152G11107 [Penicillium antarcticum]
MNFPGQLSSIFFKDLLVTSRSQEESTTILAGDRCVNKFSAGDRGITKFSAA